VTAYNGFTRDCPRVKRWTRQAYQNGMVHVSATGRRLPLDRDRTYAVVNYACQSAARDVLGQSLIDMDAADYSPTWTADP